MAAVNPTAGSNLNSVAAPNKQTLSTNYIDFTASGTAGWAQQYVPDLYDQEAEVFGQRTISGMLAQVGAEEAMTSDQVIWSEQGRLHLKLTGTVATAASNTITITGHDTLRVGDTIVIHNDSSAGKVLKCRVAELTDANTVKVYPYTAPTLASDSKFANGNNITVFVYGSEFAKGTSGRSEVIAPEFKSFTNKPVIIKDKYEISGSDASQLGWIEVTGEEGQTGYLWYLKAEGDTRARFTDYLEMMCVEGEKRVSNSNIAATMGGTEGLFAAINDRGHYSGGILGTTAADDLGSFDNILKKFDAQGAIEENMLYCNRTVSLAIDDMLAAQNSYGSGGTSYGIFNNDEDMALNLGFAGFRRGGYDFYKSDWKYLNDAVTRGSIGDNDVRGVVIPAGVTSVYDEGLGKNLKRPFLHVRYRASQTDDRKLKTWVTGSVGGNITSDLDAMEVHYLSERCLVVQGGNNFMLLN